jgi:glycosyltransferase involved in cell wall biosynthesis
VSSTLEQAETSPRQEAWGRIAVGAMTCDDPAAGGIQRYTREVLREMLRRDADVVGYVASPRVHAGHPRQTRLVRPERLAQGNFAGNLLRLLWHQAVLPAALRRENAAVFYSTIPDGMFAPRCPQVITIHDLIPLRFPASSPRQKHYFRFVVPKLIEASAAVVTMSEATRQDLQRFYGVEGDRVHVVHQGYRDEVFRSSAGEEDARVRARHGLGSYLLSVGESRPYKNVPRLLEAFARLRAPGLQLALAGRVNPREVDLPALAARLGIGDRVAFLGFVPDEELAALYRGAEAFVFPSLYEGFGIPPLEAMACGCPVVASDVAAIPEVCGDAAVYVDGREVDSIVDGMERVLADSALRATLRQQGLERAAGFSYARAAGKIMQVLRACAGQGERLGVG